MSKGNESGTATGKVGGVSDVTGGQVLPTNPGKSDGGGTQSGDRGGKK